MANRITTLFDFKQEGGGLGRIKSEMAGVDGLTNKLRAGWGGMTTEFKNSQSAQVAALGSVGVVAAASIAAASDLEESINAVNVSYGKAAESVLALGEDSATSFGMSKAAFNSFAVQFSGFAKGIASSEGREVAEVIDELTVRIADFASVMNLDVAEATAVFMSTLSGETEPIRKFGKDISAAAVEQHALATGLIESKSEMTEAIKVQARYSLLMQETNDVAGDFANTSDSLANSQKTLKAQITDLSAELGAKLLPAVASSVSALSDMITEVEELKSAIDGIPGIDKALGPLGKLTNYPATMLGLANKQLGLMKWEAAKAVDGVQAVGRWLGIGGDEAKTAADKTKHLSEMYGEAAWAARGLAPATEDVAVATERSSAAYSMAALEAAAAAGATVIKTKADEDQADAAADAADAAQKQADAINEVYDATLQMIGGDIAAREAKREALDAQHGLSDALEEAGDDWGAIEAAVDDATKAQLDAAQAAVDYKVQQAAANGATLNAQTQAGLMAGELRKLQGEMAVGSPLYMALQAYIDKLNAVPRNIVTNFSVAGNSVRSDTAAVKGQYGGGRASGGPVSAGNYYGIVEKGEPELLTDNAGNSFLIPGKSGQVTPLDKMGSGSAGGGGNTYNMTFNVGRGVDGPELGRAVVQEIKRYERNNGPGWRR